MKSLTSICFATAVLVAGATARAEPIYPDVVDT